ncbi:hypothetical protein JX266_014374 [Neoarthrinium moseri]|nr:hypothetical protein JX266_014374 [Neoarthrinium moseri]
MRIKGDIRPLVDGALLHGLPSPPASIPEACCPLAPGGGTPGDATGHRESTPEPPSYAIDCILERWKKDVFLVRWLGDGSSSWVPQSDILDDDLLEAFENNYSGYQDGLEMARAGRHSGRTRYRIYWKGRSSSEAVWSDGKDLSPALLAQLQRCRQKPRKRRRC